MSTTIKVTIEQEQVHQTVNKTESLDIQKRYARLPNPAIPISEYNLVTRYCERFPNMTRQDFVELAIIEKLHAGDLLSQEDFGARCNEIRSRLPRGQRKGTRNASSK